MPWRSKRPHVPGLAKPIATATLEVGRAGKLVATELQRFHTQIGAVRGLCTLVAFEVVRDPLSKQPAPEPTDRLLITLRERGLLALKAGLYGNVLRVLVPLTIEWPLLE